MTNLPKFIRIEKADGRVYFINISKVEEVIITSEHIEFSFQDDSHHFSGDEYPIAKAAWLDYWKVSP